MQSEYNTSGCSLQIKNQKHLQNMEELLEIYTVSYTHLTLPTSAYV